MIEPYELYDAQQLFLGLRCSKRWKLVMHSFNETVV